MSGGVDSSVTAALVKQAGYRVVGAYMKNWSQDLPGFECPWKEDYLDAKRVAVQLGIDFKMFDFEKQYKQKVVNYMIEEYKKGRTPNPDIMCNQEIKFKLFYETAKQDGADMIATGHYAVSKNGLLYKAKDQSKDQTYFLYRVSKKALKQTIFPLGELTKNQVRQKAKQLKLATANKKESMGICFVGKVGIKEFLSQYVKTKPGPIINQYGQEIGQHDGAIYYTIGQRHGLGVGGGMPVYVTGKNMANNTVYVSSVLDSKELWLKEINLINHHWIDKKPIAGKSYHIRTRHRAELVPGRFSNSLQQLYLEHPVRAVTAGQSVVVYDGDLVIGGAIVS